MKLLTALMLRTKGKSENFSPEAETKYIFFAADNYTSVKSFGGFLIYSLNFALEFDFA